MPSKKIVPELTVEERIANATRDRDQARDELIRLIQQKPSSNLFVRTFVRIRNFFHSLLPTWNMFKPKLKVALEKFTVAHTAWRELVRDKEKLPNQTSQSKKSIFLFSRRNNLSATEPLVDSYQEISDSLITVFDENITQESGLNRALKAYIDKSVYSLDGTKLDSFETSPSELWCSVREAMNDTKVTPALENILFKLKVLYPSTVEYDESYEAQRKQGTTSKWYDSTTNMVNTSFLKSTKAPEPAQTKSEFGMFRSMLGCKQLPPDEMKRLKTQKDLDAIQERINDLSTKCDKISKINNLRLELQNLLNASIQGDQVRVKQSNKTITGWMNDLQVKLIHRNSSTNDTEIRNAKEILATLQKDINTLNQEYLKNISTVNSDEDSTLRL